VAKPSADPAGRQHPQPEHLLAFVEKMVRQTGRNYAARTAEMIKRDFPGSAAQLLPKLRVIYKAGKP
jgi:hypothetical protein